MKAERLKWVVKRSSILLLVGFLYFLYVKKTGYGIPCVFYRITGFKCPGCGITHMVLTLLEMDIRTAFYSHPMLFVLLPLLIVVCGINLVRYVLTGEKKLKRAENFILYICIGLLLGFSVCRNIYGC